MLTDTHAHLDFPEFAADFREIVSRAEAAGVTRIITIGTSLESSRRAVELAEQHEQIFAVVGIHPGVAEEAPENAIAELRQIARHPRVVAIGETGLDYHRLPGGTDGEARNGAYKAAQAWIFEQQLDLAVELGLNAVIHQRDAWDDTLSVLGRWTGKLRVVFHCFGERKERAQQVLALGHLVSFTGIVTFKNAQVVQEVAAWLRADAFMVETDCPYLAPVPNRGKRCEPAYVRLVAERIAELRGTTVEEIAAQTERTANAFFRFGR